MLDFLEKKIARPFLRQAKTLNPILICTWWL